MLGRGLSDLLQVLIFFFSASPYQNESNLKDDDVPCHILGTIFTTALIGSGAYYLSICFDLYLTLTNPFRKPASNSLMIHFIVWIIAAALCGTVGAFRAFTYRQDFQFCFTEYKEGLNIWNVFVVYMPAAVLGLGGMFMSYWSIRR